jgi:CBS domain-containing protein
LLVIRGEELIGIFTERDVLQRVVGQPAALDGPIDAVMTPRPITVLPDTTAADALWLMDDHHFRNLPVVDRQGRILGDMSYAPSSTIWPPAIRSKCKTARCGREQYPSKPEGGD